MTTPTNARESVKPVPGNLVQPCIVCRTGLLYPVSDRFKETCAFCTSPIHEACMAKHVCDPRSRADIFSSRSDSSSSAMTEESDQKDMRQAYQLEVTHADESLTFYEHSTRKDAEHHLALFESGKKTEFFKSLSRAFERIIGFAIVYTDSWREFLKSRVRRDDEIHRGTKHEFKSSGYETSSIQRWPLRGDDHCVMDRTVLVDPIGKAFDTLVIGEMIFVPTVLALEYVRLHGWRGDHLAQKQPNLFPRTYRSDFVPVQHDTMQSSRDGEPLRVMDPDRLQVRQPSRLMRQWTTLFLTAFMDWKTKGLASSVIDEWIKPWIPKLWNEVSELWQLGGVPTARILKAEILQFPTYQQMEDGDLWEEMEDDELDSAFNVKI